MSDEIAINAARNAAHEAQVAFERDQGNLPALLLAADGLYSVGLNDETSVLLDLAMATNPEGAATARTLSGLLDAVGRRREALPWARRAVSARPGDPEARMHLGSLLCAEDLHAEAIPHLRTHVAGENPHPAAWRMLSFALGVSGDPHGAVAAARGAVAVEPNEASHLLHLAGTLVRIGASGDALAAADRAIEINPMDPMGPRVRSGIREAMEDLGGALTDARRAVELAPDDRDLQAHLENIERAVGLHVSDGLKEVAQRTTHTRVMPPPPGGWEKLTARGRSIAAIALRDARTRHARSRLGYAWAIIEPLAHLGTLGVLFWLVNTGPAPVGESLFLYYATGLIPYLAFSHAANMVANSHASAGSLLSLPAVGPLDMPASAGALQLWTDVMVGTLILVAATLVGLNGMPADPASTAAGFLLAWSLGATSGLVGMVVGHFVHSWSHAWNSVVRLLYFASGIYYSPMQMPWFIREILEWNPLLHAVEWFRAGFFRGYDPSWLDRSYGVTFVAVLLILGLCMEKVARRRMRRNFA